MKFSIRDRLLLTMIVFFPELAAQRFFRRRSLQQDCRRVQPASLP